MVKRSLVLTKALSQAASQLNFRLFFFHKEQLPCIYSYYYVTECQTKKFFSQVNDVDSVRYTIKTD